VWDSIRRCTVLFLTAGEQHLGNGQWWSVPAAVLGVYLCMSTVAASFPEFILLKQAMMSFGVMSTPAVVVDNNIVHSGPIPQREKITTWLKDD
jgi:hypothetical protein